jgi:uncharacterized protein (TIGR03437 family)
MKITAVGALWFCAAGAAPAQITGIATNDGASVVYFSSPFNLVGTPAPASAPKIFVWDANGFRLVADRFPAQDAAISDPFVSGDGSLIGYRGTYVVHSICGFMRLCDTTYVLTALQRNGEIPEVLNGAAVISADGRYAGLAGPVRIDLTTGQQVSVPSSPLTPYASVDSVASGGTMLLHHYGLFVWNELAGLRPIPGNPPAVMDDDATTVISQDGITLWLYDIATGTRRIFANGHGASISRTGNMAAFLSPVGGVEQAWAVSRDGSLFVQLTSEPVGIKLARVSGDGNYVLVVTAANAILKFDLVAGTSTQVLQPAAAPACGTCSAVRGSLTDFPVVGLVMQTVTAEPPLPAKLNGYELLVDGVPVPLASISPAGINFQMPWEAPPFVFVSIRLKTPDPSPVFEPAPGSVFIGTFLPSFVTVPCTGPPASISQCAAASHPDGSPVSNDNPARAGEVLTFFLTGMGAVSPPVATGAAAPENPPAVVLHPFGCYLEEYGLGAPVNLGNLTMVAAELTPGAVGTYRVTAQLPAQLGTMPVALVHCEGSDYYAPAWIPVAR